MMYNSFNIIENEHLYKTESKEVKRTIRERFFSWPWKPWVKTRIVTLRVPDDHVYMMGTTLFCHPAVATALRQELGKAG